LAQRRSFIWDFLNPCNATNPFITDPFILDESEQRVLPRLFPVVCALLPYLSFLLYGGYFRVSFFLLYVIRHMWYEYVALVIRLTFGRLTMSPNRIAAHFKTLDLGDVPHSRAGKHKKIVSMILRDLDQLKDGAALRVPLAELGSTKENVRSALNRATRSAKRTVATATDEDFLYVWNVRESS